MNNFTFLIMLLDCLAFFICTFTNVHELEQDLPYLKEVVGFKKTYCKKCSNYKPERTHHCSVCDKCVQKMDHHCPWIVNCVGQRNHKSFLLFTIYSMAIFSTINKSIFSLGLSFSSSDPMTTTNF